MTPRAYSQHLSKSLSDFVVGTQFGDLSPLTVETSKRCLVDAVGVSLAASGLGEGCSQFFELAAAQGGRADCTVFGRTVKVPVEAAAFANGSMAHALDYEDAHDGTSLHPNAPTVPAAFAVAEAYGAIDGKEFITAIAIGCDVAVRLARGAVRPLSDFGWYPPPIFAAFGATAAVCRLLKLNSSQVCDAFSLMLCQATCSGEIIYSPHSVIRAVRDAFVARGAVTAALLARRGVTGFDLPFEGKAGFYMMFARSAANPETVLRGLGKRFAIDEISFKPWPSCRGTHAAIEGILALRNATNIDADQVCAIELRGCRTLRILNEPHASKRRPSTAIDAKFSLPFAAATALVHGHVSLNSFTPKALGDESVLELAQKVELTIDDTLPEGTLDTGVGVVLCSGKRHHIQIDKPLGHPDNPMLLGSIRAKFIDCARHAARQFNETPAAAFFDRVMQLETVADVGSELGAYLLA